MSVELRPRLSVAETVKLCRPGVDVLMAAAAATGAAQLTIVAGAVAVQLNRALTTWPSL